MYGLFTGPKQVVIVEKWPLLEVQRYIIHHIGGGLRWIYTEPHSGKVSMYHLPRYCGE